MHSVESNQRQRKKKGKGQVKWVDHVPPFVRVEGKADDMGDTCVRLSSTIDDECIVGTAEFGVGGTADTLPMNHD